LGGRLALHALLEKHSPWKKAVIISANPGLKSPEERNSRLQADQKWAEKFKNDPWEQVLTQWNDQPLFGGKSLPLIRPENSANKQLHAQVLMEFSLAYQNDL